MSECVFCDVNNLKGYWRYVDREKDIVLFEPLNPVVPGHVCFMPVQHVRDFGDKPYVTAEVMRQVAEYVSDDPLAYNVITSRGREATQSVMHLHIHVVPRTTGDGLMLPWSTQASQSRSGPGRTEQPGRSRDGKKALPSRGAQPPETPEVQSEIDAS